MGKIVGNGIRLAKRVAKYTISLAAEAVHLTKWFLSKNRNNRECLNRTERKEKIIVSLTSFPGRINSVSKTIETILNQKDCKPDKVELWLAESQFEKKEEELPQNLLKLKEYGLDIRWCDDIRSYKKLLPALVSHPTDIIVTADDDVYYSRKWLEKLYKSYKMNSTAIHCHRATKIIQKNGKLDVVVGGIEYYPEPACLNKLVGVGGVLYPPNSLDEEVFNTQAISKYASTNDDIWFWFMAILNNYKINVVEKNEPSPITVLGALNSSKLSDVNDRGQNLFWVQLNQMMEQYVFVKNEIMRELAERDSANNRF